MSFFKILTVLALACVGASALFADNDLSLDSQTTEKNGKAVKKADKQDKKTVKKSGKNLLFDPSFKQYLDSISPSEKARLKELYQQDPDKFREEISARVIEFKKQENSQQQAINAVADKYRKAQTAEEKQKYLNQLKELSRKEFNRNLEKSKNQLENLEKRVNTLRQTYENRKKNADKIVNDQIEYLTRDPSLNW